MENIISWDTEIYENQRYMPLSGWSSKGLMLTDRSAFSTEDGTSKFSTIDEASKQMTSEGKHLFINCFQPKPDCGAEVDFVLYLTAGWSAASQWTVELLRPGIDEVLFSVVLSLSH